MIVSGAMYNIYCSKHVNWVIFIGFQWIFRYFYKGSHLFCYFRVSHLPALLVHVFDSFSIIADSNIAMAVVLNCRCKNNLCLPAWQLMGCWLSFILPETTIMHLYIHPLKHASSITCHQPMYTTDYRLLLVALLVDMVASDKHLVNHHFILCYVETNYIIWLQYS